LQRTVGNRAVQRLLAPRDTAGLTQRQGGENGFDLDDETTGRINRARGGGQPLPAAVQTQMGETMGYDFSRVRVHTGPEADALNKELSAQAFTTGSDIFFKRGAYEPASGGGRELIAHELRHVVQQSSGLAKGAGGRIYVRPASDPLEQEAERDAGKVPVQSHVAKRPVAVLGDHVGTPTAREGPLSPAGPERGRAPKQPKEGRGSDAGEEGARPGPENQAWRSDNITPNPAPAAPRPDSIARSGVSRHGRSPAYDPQWVGTKIRPIAWMANPSASTTIQRAYLATKDGTPLEKGTIIVCRNPSDIGHRAVQKGGAQKAQNLGGDLTHAAIVGERAETRIESMGSTVEENKVDARNTEYNDGPIPDVSKDAIYTVAKASVGEDKSFIGKAYDIFGARAAISKGKLEKEVEEAQHAAARPDLSPKGRKRLEKKVEKKQRQIKKIETKRDFPPLIKTGEIHRPTARTWCVQFAAQAVQAAMVNQGYPDEDIADWKELVHNAPHVRNIYAACGPWRLAKILEPEERLHAWLESEREKYLYPG
jgi:hypothetical protein